MDSLSLRNQVDSVLQAHKGDPFRLAQELKKLLKEAENASDIYLVGKINLHLSICVFRQGRRDSILPYAYKAVNILEGQSDPALLARSYNLLGIAYAGLGSFQRAITAYNKALKVIRGRKTPGIRKETLLNNIGDAYFQMGVYQKSLHIAMNCLSDCRRVNPDNYVAIVLYGINISDSCCSLGQFQKAKETLDDVESEAGHIPRSILLCGYYTRRAWVLYAIGDLEGGAKNTDMMLELAHDNCDSYEFHPVFDKIASIQIENGDMERARLSSDTLTSYAEKSGHTLDLIISNRVQANICRAEGDYDRALTLYKKLNLLYENWMKEQKAIQYESQKSVEAANRQIEKLMQKISLSEEKAERDALTGLMNRSALINITDSFIRNAKEKGRKIGGMFLDIDYFKEYNDTYGHAAGDEAIKFIASVCIGEETPNIRFFRYGGDEYFGIVYDCKDEEIEQLALRISGKIRSSDFEHVKNPNGHHLTVSIGIVSLDLRESDYTILDVIKYADKALYHAKDRGKDDVFSYHVMQNSEWEFRRIENKQRNSID